MADLNKERPDLEHIRKRVREKTEDYKNYGFTQVQNDRLKAFFDLAQEFESLHDLYRICVAIPLESLNLESALYLLDESEEHLELVCNSREGIIREKRPIPTGVYLSQEPYVDDDSYIIPIYRKPPLAGISPVDLNGKGKKAIQRDHALLHKSSIMGVFEIFPQSNLTETDRFFLTKYTNRIGYRLHNRLVARQNVRHLKFINSLVMDIEHNVIIPNMYFRHLFNQLKKKIVEMEELEKMMAELKKFSEVPDTDCKKVMDSITTLRQDLMLYHQEMQKHHANVSLFLESLFRREHFQHGHLVLHAKRCLVEKQIIKPQLDHYENRLAAKSITIDKPREMAEEEFPIMVDVGLLSQVYANLISNAIKYTEEIINHNGNPRKALAYGRDIITNFFGPGQDGIKFNVFSTGSHFSEQESKELYSEGYRGKNSADIPGTGHGLAFIRHVIELHGGKVGYEPTPQGNNFYFVLPMPSAEPPEEIEAYHIVDYLDEKIKTKLKGAERRSHVKDRRFRKERRKPKVERRRKSDKKK